MDMSPGSLVSSDVQLLMIHRYETDYGIYNHDRDRDPYSMALVALHPAENSVEHSRLYERMRRFAKSKVKELFGLNFQEFIQQPRHVVLEMFRIAESAAKTEDNKVGDLTRDIENSLRGQQ